MHVPVDNPLETKWSDRPREHSDNGIAWIRHGAGRPVVLIHGVGLRAESMAGLLDALAADHEVRAFDLPGHGHSVLGDVGDSLAGYTDAIVGAMASIRSPAIVVGHSMGAMVALDMAIRHPGRCGAVIALNAIFRRTADAATAVRRRAAALSSTAVSDPAPTLSRWFGDDADSVAAKACRHWLESVDPRAYKAAYTVFAGEDGPDDVGLSSLACPALFVTGAAEPNSTPEMSRAMGARAPRGRAAVITGAAHMMPMTHDEPTVAAIREFLGREMEVTP